MCLWTHTPKWMAVSGFNWASQIFLLSKRVNHYTIGGINVTCDMVKNYKDVGANAIFFNNTNSTSNWDGLEPSFWTDTILLNVIPSVIFGKGAQTDFVCSSLSVKLTDFYQQVILYWKWIYSHTFCPYNTPVWNSRCIRLGTISVYGCSSFYGLEW